MTSPRDYLKEPKLGCWLTTPSFTELLKPLATQPLSKTTSIPYNFGKKWKMEFHPGKCQLLRITNKTEPIKSTYFIHDTPISETDSAKYLGVVIDTKLKWTKQYTNLIKKCNGTLAFIKRNLSNSPSFVKKQCYLSLIRPKLEYACAVWDPHCSTHIENLEMVQKGTPDSLQEIIKWNLERTAST